MPKKNNKYRVISNIESDITGFAAKILMGDFHGAAMDLVRPRLDQLEADRERVISNVIHEQMHQNIRDMQSSTRRNAATLPYHIQGYNHVQEEQ
jgi:hypothetical protein